MPAIVVTTDDSTLPATVYDQVKCGTTHVAIVEVGDIAIIEFSFDDLIAAVIARTDDSYDTVLRELDRQFFLVPELFAFTILRWINGEWIDYWQQFIKLYSISRTTFAEYVVWSQDDLDAHPMLNCACLQSVAQRKMIRVTNGDIVYYVGLHQRPIDQHNSSQQRYLKYLTMIEQPHLHFTPSSLNLGYDGEWIYFPYKTVCPINPTWQTLLQFVANPSSPIRPRYLLKLPRISAATVITIDILTSENMVDATYTFAWGDYATTFA